MPKPAQFQARHDWPAIRQQWHAMTQQGLSVVAIAAALGVPRGTLGEKAAKWRKELAQAAPAAAPAPQAGGGQQLTQTPSTQQPTPPDPTAAAGGLSPQEQAAQILRDAMPNAARALVAQLTNADGTPSRDAQTTRAALQLLKDLQHTDEADTASPYASMSDAELEARAAALWPSVMEARRLLAHGQDASAQAAQ